MLVGLGALLIKGKSLLSDSKLNGATRPHHHSEGRHRAAMESVEAQLDALNGWPVASSVAVWPVKFCQRITAMST